MFKSQLENAIAGHVFDKSKLSLPDSAHKEAVFYTSAPIQAYRYALMGKPIETYGQLTDWGLRVNGNDWHTKDFGKVYCPYIPGLFALHKNSYDMDNVAVICIDPQDLTNHSVSYSSISPSVVPIKSVLGVKDFKRTSHSFIIEYKNISKEFIND